MKYIQNHLTQTVIVVTALTLIVLIGISSLLRQPPSPSNTTTGTVSNTSFQSLNNLPTLPPNQGGGLNTEAPEVKTSEQEIDKLKASLPFRTTVRLSDGHSAIVGIPSVEFLDNTWTIIVYTDIDFQAIEGTPEYEVNKMLFKKAADEVQKLMISKGVDPKKVYIQWGDKEYVRYQANEWLK